MYLFTYFLIFLHVFFVVRAFNIITTFAGSVRWNILHNVTLCLQCRYLGPNFFTASSINCINVSCSTVVFAQNQELLRTNPFCAELFTSIKYFLRIPSSRFFRMKHVKHTFIHTYTEHKWKLTGKDTWTCISSRLFLLC